MSGVHSQTSSATRPQSEPSRRNRPSPDNPRNTSGEVARDALVVELAAPPTALPVLVGHTVALRAELSSEGQVVFVSGVGQIADRATVSGGDCDSQRPLPAMPRMA